MPHFVKAASLDEIPENGAVCANVRGHRIALFNVNGEIHAIGDVCTHAEASLSEGEVSGDEVTCPLHFATFNIHTGECTGPPAEEDVTSYPVRIVGDVVEIDIEVEEDD